MKQAGDMSLINQRFDVGFIQQCRRAADYSKVVSQDFLKNYHFKSEENSQNGIDGKVIDKKAKEISEKLADYKGHLSHGRPLHFKDLKAMGMKVKSLEEDNELQDDVLSIYHTLEIIFDLYKNTTRIIGSPSPEGAFATYASHQPATPTPN